MLLLLLLQVTEMPEMEERKNALTLNNARMKKELQEIENTILWVPEHCEVPKPVCPPPPRELTNSHSRAGCMLRCTMSGTCCHTPKATSWMTRS